MTFDHAEFLEAGRERRAARVRAQESAPSSLLRMAAVSMENLVGQEEWDAYLKLLSARAEDHRTAIEQAREALVSPALVNYEQIMALKLRQATLQGALDAIEACIAMPRVILEAARSAQNG